LIGHLRRHRELRLTTGHGAPLLSIASASADPALARMDVVRGQPSKARAARRALTAWVKAASPRFAANRAAAKRASPAAA